MDDIKATMEKTKMIMDDVFTKTTNAVNASIENANKVLWGKASHEKTMMDIHRLIKKESKE